MNAQRRKMAQRRLIMLLAIIGGSLAAQSVASAQAGMKEKREQAVLTTWYYPKDTPKVGSGLFTTAFYVYPYVGKKDDGKKWIRLKVDAVIPTTLKDVFATRDVHLVIDGKETDLNVEYREQDYARPTSSGRGHMRVDIGGEMVELAVRALAEGKEVYVTLSDGHSRRLSFKPSPEQLQTIHNVLNFYDAK
jgi:hypothetical protein